MWRWEGAGWEGDEGGRGVEGKVWGQLRWRALGLETDRRTLADLTNSTRQTTPVAPTPPLRYASLSASCPLARPYLCFTTSSLPSSCTPDESMPESSSLEPRPESDSSVEPPSPGCSSSDVSMSTTSGTCVVGGTSNKGWKESWGRGAKSRSGPETCQLSLPPSCAGSAPSAGASTHPIASPLLFHLVRAAAHAFAIIVAVARHAAACSAAQVGCQCGGRQRQGFQSGEKSAGHPGHPQTSGHTISAASGAETEAMRSLIFLPHRLTLCVHAPSHTATHPPIPLHCHSQSHTLLPLHPGHAPSHRHRRHSPPSWS